MSKVFVTAVLLAGAAYVVQFDHYKLLPKNDVPGLINMLHGAESDERRLDRDSFASEIADYDRKQTTDGARDVEMVNQYYNMVTDFYEYGWGQSFHFAHTWKDEGHDDSIKRHENRLATELGIKPGNTVLDCGCGVGGPARQVARFSGGHVKGVTLNNYQVARANAITEKEGMANGKVEFVQGDFTKLNEKDESFDFVYAIEATCHAPKLEDVYGEIYRVLKKGGRFASYEWITAAGFDPKNQTHKDILTEIEYGNGLPPVRSPAQVEKAAAAVGFKLIKQEDLAQDMNGTRPWYHRLDMTGWERQLTHATCWFLELIGWADKGTVSIHGMLLRAAQGLVDGGKTNAFTPMHLFVFEKI
ncbi:Cycloartenol-C-24-methyltransferase 1 [Diplonema papillatum]|nr:Cycloartenol-C-24-methyltransferase 1 [Diplonema papillatum]